MASPRPADPRFTMSVPLGMEALGFPAPGNDLHVTTPRNIGGGVAYCHPRQFGVLLLVEAVRELRARRPPPSGRHLPVLRSVDNGL